MYSKRIAGTLMVLLMVFSIGGMAFGAPSIRLVVNGKEISAEVLPQMVQGRVLVPIRFVAQALEKDVMWDAKTRTVTINDKEIWPDIVKPDDPRVRAAVNVVSRYLASIVATGLPGDSIQLTELTTAKARDLHAWGKDLKPEQDRYVTQAFMLTGEHAVVRFEILDVRPFGENMEVAARVFEMLKGNEYVNYRNIVYTVVWEPRENITGGSIEVALINSERFLSTSGSIEANYVW